MTCPRHESLSGKDEQPQSMAESHTVSMIHEGAPLGPDSLLWHYMDNRMTFMASAGIVQLMIPAIGAGVADHSNFFNEPLERIIRSMQPIAGSVFDGNNAKQTGEMVRDYHHDIKGLDHEGHRYHALNPQTWADTHLTFVDAVFQVADRFSHRNLTDTEREQLYAETITWYQNYGVTDRLLPEDYSAFQSRLNEMYDNELVMTNAAKAAVDMAVNGQIPRPNVVPEKVWSLLKLPMAPTGDLMGNLIIAGLPEQVRERYKDEIPYSNLDKVQVKLFEEAVKFNWRFVAKPLRHPPRAYEAFLRESKPGSLKDRIDSVGYNIGSTAVKRSFNTFKIARSLVTS